MGEQAQRSLDDREIGPTHPLACELGQGFHFSVIRPFVSWAVVVLGMQRTPGTHGPGSLSTSSQNRRPLPFQVKFPISPDYAPAADSFLTAAAKRRKREHGRIKKKRQNSPRLGL